MRFQVRGHLLADGMHKESLRELDQPVGTEVVMVETDRQCRVMLEIRHEAFGEPGPVTDADVARAMSSVKSGGVAAVVVDSTSAEAVASGACLVPYDKVTELTSIGVRPAWRRQGIGAAITALSQPPHFAPEARSSTSPRRTTKASAFTNAWGS